MRNGMGLGFKIGILLSIFGVMAAGLTGYYSYTSSRAILINAAEHDLLTATQVLGRRVSIALDEVAGNARLLAELPTAVEIGIGADAGPRGARSEASESVLAEAFTAMLAVHPEYFQVRLISARDHGIELVRVDRDDARLTRVRGDDLQEKSHFPYVFKTLRLARGEVYICKITINHEHGAHSGLDKPTLQVATPVFAVDGARLGLVVINVDLNGLFGLLRTDLPRHYQLYLTNEWGDFLIHPDPALTFGFDRGRRYLLKEQFPQAAGILDGLTESLVTHIPTMPSAEPAAMVGMADGQVAAFSRLPFGDASARRFVVIGLAQPLHAILRDTRVLGANTIKVVLAFSVLAILLSFIVARIVTRPLNMMVKAVNRFSREHVMGELPLRQNDEIGLLAQSFNDMQVEIKAHLSELYESKALLDHLVRHDTLTGLPNRMMFFDRLERAIVGSRRTDKALAVFFIDLDRFKEINDSLGHRFGDVVLKTIAQRLKAMVREVDIVARLSGDEFIILFSDLDEVHHLAAIAQKIVDGLSQVMVIENHELAVSASIGISLFPHDADNASELVHKADVAMYQSKSRGRNVFQFYSPEFDLAD